MHVRRLSALVLVAIVGALFVFHLQERSSPVPHCDGRQPLLRVIALDAESGRPVNGVKWGLSTERWGPEGKLLPQVHARVRMREHAVLGLPTGRERWGEAEWRGAPPNWERAMVIVEPPSGYVAWDETDLTLLRTAPFAASFEYRYPLRREMDVTLVVDGRASKAPTELVICALVAANKIHYYSETELWARDGLLVKGVPYFRGETVSLLAASHGNWSHVAQGVARANSQLLPQEFHIPGAFWIEARMPESPERRLQILLAAIGAYGPRGFVNVSDEIEAGVTLRVDRGDSPFVESYGPSQEKPRLHAGCQVRVLARRITGAPAVGARVSLNRESCLVGRNGVALFLDVPPGPAELRLRGTGVLSTSESVVVPAGRTCLLTLTEREGGTLQFQVVDAAGRGLPFARLFVSTHTVDMTGPVRDIQRLDWFTDKEGRRTFQQVDPGPAWVGAEWGDRIGEAQVTVRQSAETSVSVVVLPRWD